MEALIADAYNDGFESWDNFPYSVVGNAEPGAADVT
jgi:hypothetical protein